MNRENPKGMEFYVEQSAPPILSLPVEAVAAGFELVFLKPPFRDYGADPYIIRDRWGHVIYQWPDDYEPKYIEVMEVCKKLLEEGH